MSANSFWIHAAAKPDHVAVVEPDGVEVLAGDLLAATNRNVHGLRALGLSKGDTVATILKNGAAMVEVALSAGQAGMYVTPVNHRLTAHEAAFILTDCGAKAVVCDPARAALVRDALSEADAGSSLVEGGLFCTGPADDLPAGFRPLAELGAGQPDTAPEGRLGGFTMTYTSGTTGRPRGVRRPTFDIPADVLADNFTGFLRMFGIADEGVHLVVAPMYHTAVLNWCLYSLHLGHTVVLMDKWTAEGMLERIDRYKVTTTHMVPTQMVRLLALSDEERAGYDVSSMRQAVHGAAPCPVPVKQAMLDWWGPVVYEYYAASEGGGTLATPAQWLERPGTVGAPWPISEIRILDDEGAALPAGEVGTVWIRMGEHRFEYKDDADKTDKAWSGGFFTVGDAGYMDDAGYLYLCDRKSDMIISGGVNIYPAEIECELILHPEVADCAVFGIPDDDWGEQVKAVIEPTLQAAPGDDALAERILSWLEPRLAKYKRPKSVDFVAELPRDPNGKLYKRNLRDPYWADRESAI